MADVTADDFGSSIGGASRASTEVRKERIESAEDLPTRINLALSPRGAARVVALRDKTDASSNAEVIRSALRIYEAIVEEVEKGSQFLIKNADGATTVYRFFW